MKKTIKFSAVLISFLYLQACNHNETTNTIREYDPATGETFEYNYTLKGHDTVLDGKTITYNNANKIIAAGNFVNGKLEGNFTYFDNYGNKKTLLRYDSDVLTEKMHFSDKQKIEKYILYNINENVTFIVRFDTKGNIINYEGYPLADIVYDKKMNSKDELKVGDTIKYDLIIPYIPGVKRQFKIKHEGKSSYTIKRKIIALTPTKIQIEEIVNKLGKNIIDYELKLIFNNSNKDTITDNLRLSFIAF